jgi:hypothetical protein
MEFMMTGKSKWIVVAQVKSLRVVYFTSDQTYQPPTENDHYYYSVYLGEMPPEITLQNCWGWKFNGQKFLDARDAPKVPLEMSILESNRNALMRILIEKINLVRAPFLPLCGGGDHLRKSKLDEANRYVSADLSDASREEFPLLQALAAGRAISMQEAATIIQTFAAQHYAMMLESERFREQLSHAIKTATTLDQLYAVREWLLDRVYPELTKQFTYAPDNTEPIDLDAPLSDIHRIQEIACLKVRLRELINQKRAALQSEYLQNDVILRRKLSIAKLLIENGEASVRSDDLELLQAYAGARNITLNDAANLILNSAVARAAILQTTEIEKDRLMAKIEGITTLRSIKEVNQWLRQPS